MRGARSVDVAQWLPKYIYIYMYFTHARIIYIVVTTARAIMSTFPFSRVCVIYDINVDAVRRVYVVQSCSFRRRPWCATEHVYYIRQYVFVSRKINKKRERDENGEKEAEWEVSIIYNSKGVWIGKGSLNGFQSDSKTYNRYTRVYYVHTYIYNMYNRVDCSSIYTIISALYTVYYIYI